ncbi:hypothetical protein EG68_06291 [Paragonimus skrjabini miyazakii]|uniref:LIM zinc-binding domain-containing protein n=1 Tax=Paragonimus skrjabini miyazakii TaxID=59628 RepID=A0A8S9YYB6_9TREM|nr:hypothetical protein EG68_06291 [Paragonimus skrjabini miyazakii]
MDGTVNQTSQRTFFSESRQQQYEEKFNSTRILGRCCLCDAGVNPQNHFTLNGKDYHFDCLNCTVCGCRLGSSMCTTIRFTHCPKEYLPKTGNQVLVV